MSILEMSARENQVLQKVVALLKEEIDPKRIILFGSRAEGRHVRASDFDLAVDAAKPPNGRAWKILETINDAIGLYKADIVYLPNVVSCSDKISATCFGDNSAEWRQWSNGSFTRLGRAEVSVGAQGPRADRELFSW